MIVHGDAWEWMKSQPDNSVDVVITDPMYGLDIDLPEILRVCKGNVIAFCDPKHRYFKSDEILHWVKPISTKNTSKRMSNFVEEILVLRRADAYNHDQQWANYCGVFFDVLEGKKLHEFQKPLSLIERLMRIYSNEGDVVLDPFMGSGTTLLAAKNLNRSAIGIDIDPKCIELARSRIGLL